MDAFITEDVPPEALLSGEDLVRLRPTGYVNLKDFYFGSYSRGTTFQPLGYSTYRDTWLPGRFVGGAQMTPHTYGGEVRLRVTERVFGSEWLVPTIEGLAKLPTESFLVRRPHGSETIDLRFVVELLNFLASALDMQAAPPSLSPLGEAGIQAEWHRGGLDVEVLISPEEDERGVYVREKDTGQEFEFGLDAELFARHVGERLAVAA